MAGIDVGVLAALAVAVLLGTVVQSVVGIGLGLVGAPLFALLAPSLMPGAMLIIVVVLPILTLSRDHDDIDWRGLAWSLGARVPGTAAGVWVVSVLDDRQLGLIVGCMVLLAVALTARAVVVPINRATLVTAGTISGVTSTTSSIGGPPLAILYQRSAPSRLRSTLAVYFLVGAVFSLVGLGVAGEVTVDEVTVAAVMLVPLLLGYVASRPLKQRLDPQLVRPLVLAVCAVSSIALIVRSVT